MNTHDQRPQSVPTGRYGPAVLKALGLHLLVILMFGISFSNAPEFEQARPIVQATLVQLESSSPAMTATNQRIAGEAERTAAQRHEAEQLARQQREQEEAAQRAQQQRQQQAEREQAEQEREQARREAEQQAREQAAAEAQREAEAQAQREAQQQAQREAAEAERRAAEQARQREEEAKRQAAADAAERTRREAEAEARRQREAAEQQRKAQEEERARALAELLASEAAYQRAQADRHGDQVAASYDDLIRRYVSEQWRRPPTARNEMVVEVRISMVPTGQITDVVVTRSSGDPGFDQSAVQAVRNVGRIPEMQQLSRENPATFDRLYRQRTLRFRPEDLAY